LPVDVTGLDTASVPFSQQSADVSWRLESLRVAIFFAPVQCDKGLREIAMRSIVSGTIVFGCLICGLFSGVPRVSAADESGETKLSVEQQTAATELRALNEKLIASLRKDFEAIPAFTDKSPDAIGQYSRRGDLQMFLGNFAEAEADYKQMVVLDPAQDASHWRLGIAMYFAGHPEQAAAQFDKYHSFDNVDRENGIWRYLSHRAAFGAKKAREQLLKYEKDDRPPFPEVYRLFEGSLTSDEVLNAVPRGPSSPQRDSRFFYSHLYVGFFASAEGDTDRALNSLRESTLNSWPREAGYGPNYMWHVGRLQYLRLESAKATRQK
jgi:lipoprotein NlpI